MFGYVRPRREELKVKDWEDYQAVYCGLCHTLGRRYGFFTRFLLNYDFTFLVMVLDRRESRPMTKRKRCVACPLRGKPSCEGGDAYDLAAGESLILSYWKLRDSVADQGFWKGLPARLLSWFFRPAYRKAARLHPQFNQTVMTCLEELQGLEADKSPSLDRTADTFARILQSAAPETGMAIQDRSVSQLLYHVGRWIYLVDAWDDLEEDRQTGDYNPLLWRYPEGVEAHQEELRLTLKHSLNLASSAYQLAEFGAWTDTLGNVLYLGLPLVEQAVFTGQWKQIKALRPPHSPQNVGSSDRNN